MRQIAPLELPPRANHIEMTHYLRTPFPQIPPDDMLNIIEAATQRNPLPQPANNDPPHQDQKPFSTTCSALTSNLAE